MTTVRKPFGFCGWSVRCVAAVSLLFCASAFAGSDNTVVVPQKQQQIVRSIHKVCYTYISGSGIPQPCDRLATIPTTTNPMDRVGGR